MNSKKKITISKMLKYEKLYLNNIKYITNYKILFLRDNRCDIQTSK